MKLNPNHPVLRDLDGNWHKLLVLAMLKLGVDQVDITQEDIAAAVARPGGLNVVAHGLNDVLRLRLVSDEEARRLAQQAGGLPV